MAGGGDNRRGGISALKKKIPCDFCTDTVKRAAHMPHILQFKACGRRKFFAARKPVIILFFIEFIDIVHNAAYDRRRLRHRHAYKGDYHEYIAEKPSRCRR